MCYKVKEGKKGSTRKWYLLLAVIMAVTLLSYANSLTNQFVFDDVHVILNNRTIRGIEKIPRLLGLWKKRIISYRPIRMVSYSVDYTLNKKLWGSAGGYKGDDKGLNPLGYHISNYAYHLLTSYLVFLVVFGLVANYRIAFLSAALFALHPVHTDSVTYLSGRRDILFTLFYLAGFYFFLRYRQTRKTIFILATFLSYLLSLGSKEMGVTLPAIFICYDLVTNFPENARTINLAYFKELFRTLKRVVIYSRYLYSLIFLGALAFSYYKVFIKSPSHRSAYYGDSIATTFLTVGKILVYYIKLLLYPIRLNADYSYNAFPLSSSFFEPATFFSFIVLGVAGYGVLRLLAHHKMLAFGVIWFFVTLLPVCQIFPHHELLAEHYLYLPSFGFCLIVASLLNRLFEDTKYRYQLYASCLIIALLFSLRIVDRNKDWRDRPTFWKKTIKTAPNCARAHLSLGVFYGETGKLDEAASEYQQALVIHPRFAMAHYNLGNVYTQKGELDRAVPAYRQALAIKPQYAKAHNNLGIVYAMEGRLDKAIIEHKQAIDIAPRFADAHYNLGNDYRKKGRLDEAISAYKQALKIRPDNPTVRYNLANVYAQRGELDEAVFEYKRALSNNPYLVRVYNNLGIVYFKMNKLDESISTYRKVLSFVPDFADAYSNLGLAYLKKGMLDEAIVAFKKALAVKPDLAQAHHSLASAYYTKGNYVSAIIHCDRASALGYKNSPQLLEKLRPYR